MLFNCKGPIVAATLLLLTVAGEGQQRDSLSVLFVGNSYTYFWNLPQVVQAMAASRNIPLTTKQSTAGGVNLGQHWRSAGEIKTRAMLDKERFDKVILQDHSMRAIEAPDSLYWYGQRFGDLMRQKGIQPVLYMTWPRDYNPLMQTAISTAYRTLSEKIEADLAPVGEIWLEAMNQRPSLDLYDPDGSHTSPTGSYLTACVFFKVLTGESPVGLPRRFVSEDKYGQKIYLSIVSRNDATFCQQLVEKLINQEK